jgi:hypothetical protein
VTRAAARWRYVLSDFESLLETGTAQMSAPEQGRVPGGRRYVGGPPGTKIYRTRLSAAGRDSSGSRC